MNKEELQELIDVVDALPSRKLFLLYHRIIARISRIILAFISFGFIGYGYYISLIAQQAAVANLLNLSIALTSLSLSTFAVIVALLALISNEGWRRRDDLTFEQRIFDSMKFNADPLLLRGLIRMKMRLPKTVSLNRACQVDPQMFTEKAFLRRLLES